METENALCLAQICSLIIIIIIIIIVDTSYTLIKPSPVPSTLHVCRKILLGILLFPMRLLLLSERVSNLLNITQEASGKAEI